MEQINHFSSALPGVRLIDAEYHRFAFPRHFHLEYHIGLLLQGRQRYVYRGERHLAGAGDTLLMTPESIHDGASLPGEGYRIRVLALDPRWLEQASRSLSDGRQGAPRLTTAILRNPGLQLDLHNLHGAMRTGSRLSQESLLLQAMAGLLGLASTLRVVELEQGFAPRRWGQIREWLESRLDQPPSLEELAAFCELSPWQTLRRFSRQCGLPPHQWLTQLRLERALPLVLGGMPLSDIAVQLGFYDQAHFTRLFRRTYGLPPARLRAQL
ncbi:AraC family transcriptional regulator [Pseudomonas cavernicola]|uniref:AraC family transcriptional regulator n=1 Tax=Pseudomonas cavernicola TaxID=2320866 RepID=A0A418XB16_9PSED|nr:AraC family transcriptional regulator [Pseudomonas cavernicola]RJG09651.1 AraC family transcriptional regulator [Pseudomonas cavernicola]